MCDGPSPHIGMELMVSTWYCGCMALTLRLPEDLDHQLADLAEREHLSKHSLIVESVRRMLEEREHRAMVEEGLAYALEHDAKTLERLADS